MATIDWRGANWGWKGKEFASHGYVGDNYGFKTASGWEAKTSQIPEPYWTTTIDANGRIIRHRKAPDPNAEYDFKGEINPSPDLDTNRIISQDVGDSTSNKTFSEQGGNWYLERFGREEDLAARNTPPAPSIKPPPNTPSPEQQQQQQQQESPEETHRYQQHHHPEHHVLKPRDPYHDFMMEEVGLEYAGWWKPRMDMFQDHENGLLRVEFELPGVPSSHIHLEVEADRIMIRTLKSMSYSEKKGFYFHSERHFGNYYRRLGLPYLVDPHSTKAILENGVLKVTMRKNRVGGYPVEDVKIRQP